MNACFYNYFFLIFYPYPWFLRGKYMEIKASFHSGVRSQNIVVTGNTGLGNEELRLNIKQ